ncbi:Protein Spindly-A [Lamellibrachia satsuma]|nr:Protein Spindly-A [Lamellibrachia satsuma]
MALTKELSERENCVAQLALQVESLSAQVSKKQEEIEEIQCHATTNYNALLESREENQELKVELDIIKLESHNFKKKGNSLFGEVEDRRVEAERELVSMKVQHSSLQKQHGLLRQQMHKLKMEVAGLLQMACRHDNERMTERLLQQLSQAQSEAQLLQKKLHQYEEQERLEPRLTNRLVGSSSQATNDGSVDHMKGLFSKTESEKACLKQELHTKTLIALAESNKVMECERRIFTLDHEVKQLKAHDFRQRLQIEELRMKYEPNSLNTDKLPQRKRNIEQIPLTQKLAADRDAVPAGDVHKEIIGDDNTTADVVTNKKSDASLENGRPRSLATKCMSDINTISPGGDIISDDTTSADIVTNRKFDPSLEKRQSPLATKRTSDMNIMSPDGDCDAEVFPKSVMGRKRPTAVSDVDVTDRSSSDAVGAHQGDQQGGAKMARVAKSKSVQLEQDCKVQ